MFIRCLPTPIPTPTPTPTATPAPLLDPCILKLTPNEIINQTKSSNTGSQFPVSCQEFLDILSSISGRCYLALELGTDPTSSPIITEEVGLILVSCQTEAEEFCDLSLEEDGITSIEIEQSTTSIEVNCI